VPNFFNITVYDSEGNLRRSDAEVPIWEGPDDVRCLVSRTDGGGEDTEDITCEDLGTGVHYCSYVRSLIGVLRLVCTVNRQNILANAFPKFYLLTVTHGPVDPRSGLTYDFPIRSDTGHLALPPIMFRHVVPPFTLRMLYLDTRGNLKYGPNDNEVICEAVSQRTLDEPDFVTQLLVDYNPENAYFTLHLDLPRAGDVQIDCSIMRSGGLNRRIYAEKGLRGPIITEDIGLPMLDYGTGTIVGLTSDFISAIWDGFFKPPKTAGYAFHAEVDDGCSLLWTGSGSCMRRRPGTIPRQCSRCSIIASTASRSRGRRRRFARSSIYDFQTTWACYQRRFLRRCSSTPSPAWLLGHSRCGSRTIP
jgi:hypothetical protein